MTTIQGVPDLGPGPAASPQREHRRLFAEGVEAVRAFDGPALATYPDFRDAILETAAFLGVDPERIVLTNGLDEGILLASIAYLVNRTPEALVALGAPLTTMSGTAGGRGRQPAFEPYLSTVRMSMGARVVSVPPGKDFAFPLDGMLRAITPNTRIVYVNNPNNPSGQPMPKDAIHRIAKEAAHALVFVDEAYHDFLGENFLAEADDYPNVLIGRTFSKAFGLAGMRVGVMIASPEILAPIRRAHAAVQPERRRGGRACAPRLAIRPSARGISAQANESKELVYAACERAGLQYWKSAANFVLIDGGARARAGRRHDRRGRVRPRSHQGSGHADLLPPHRPASSNTPVRRPRRWRRCAPTFAKASASARLQRTDGARRVIDRRTAETQIKITLSLDGKGRFENSTGIRFLDHMLDLFARHGGFDLKVKATGDLDVDQHHTVEDVGIALGEAVLAGHRQQARHQSRRLLRDADGRDAGGRRDRPQRPAARGRRHEGERAAGRRSADRAGGRFLRRLRHGARAPTSTSR